MSWDDPDVRLRDLLLPGLAATEGKAKSLGFTGEADIKVDKSGLRVEIADKGRFSSHLLASRAEIDSGAFKDTFGPRLIAAFEERVTR